MTATKFTSSFKHITIIGVGLIGGSLGLAIKRRLRNVKVTGVDKPRVLRRARQRGAIDLDEPSLAKAVSQADLVFLACPTAKILQLLPDVAKHSLPTTVVTDVGSVKAEIVQRANKLFPSGNFVGGHPMAGLEFSGIDAAHPLLFENAVYVLTSTKRTKSTKKAHLKRLSAFLQTLGARVMVMNAETHDSVASVVSHLPQLTAVALMNVAGKRSTAASKHLQLAAGGFRDMTRIASSRFEIWNDILGFNKRGIDRAVQLLERELKSYRSSLRKRSLSHIKQDFSRARKFRNAIPRNMKGFLHSLSNLYVYVQDRPGVLAKMTGALSHAKINISDLELLKVREGSGGTFRLSFESKNLAGRALRILRKRGFEVEE
jgi:prephenate dehydrogenase